MFGKICAWFGGLVCGLKDRMSLMAAMVAVALLSGQAFADGEQAIQVVPPNIAWSSLPTAIISALTAPIVVGIGIALSVWVILKAVSFFRRSST